MGVRFGNIPNDQKPCGTPSCGNTRNKKDKYCSKCRNEYNKWYRDHKQKGFEIKLNPKPNNRIVLPDVDETMGLPIKWSAATEREWSTRYHHNNWEYKLLKQPYN